MGQLQQVNDPTNALSQVGLNNQDISNLIDEFNRLNDSLTGGNIRQNSQNIIVFDNTTNRVLIGYQTVLQAWGMFVSKPGVDVTSATADQLIFNSNQNIFKIATKIPLTLTYSHTNPNSEFRTTSVAHGLTYLPGFLAFNTLDPYFAGLTTGVTASKPNPTSIVGAVAGQVISVMYMEASIDATNVYLIVQTGGGEPTASYTFSSNIYLLQETFST